jgi:hypothetical protein
MPDVVIENAVRALKQRRDDLERAISALEGVNAIVARTAQSSPAVRRIKRPKGKAMSAAIKAKLRAAYAANHPGWKPKKK